MTRRLRYIWNMSGLFVYLKRAVAAVCVCFALSVAGNAQEGREAFLLEALSSAEASEIAGILDSLREIWGQSGSPAIDLLLRRGEEALDAGVPEVAVEHLTAAVDHAPEFAAAREARARAYYQLDHIGPALDDIRVVLALNPRHIGAMNGLATILEDVGRIEEALAVQEKLLEMMPAAENVMAAIGQLETQLSGRDA